MNDNNNVLTVAGLKKNYKDKTAVAGISFDFSAGEFVGLLGPNGAGKTTTIKMLTGLIRPSAGMIYYYGSDFKQESQKTKSLIGVVPQQNNLDRDLTAYENLYLHAILYAIPKALRKTRIDELLDFSGLTEYRNRQVKTFSGGTMRRLVILRALLHEPKILFLDEPTVGLDPQIRRVIWDFIVKINRMKNTTILLTTHYIEEAERLCKRVLIINDGSIIVDGTPEALKNGIGHFVLEVYKGEGIEEEFFDTRPLALAALEKSTDTCKIREVTLEDVFLRLTGRRINV
ncbi:ABC transporter ATP-binding protein [Candidatus Magnetominusculus xianensis]|uniref:Multidrug ABC transporter ATP-binding protein n=1 Tax=Candidatus Magnetominusculus xianensis TaxID=1748249 RepID=A0ABR5SJM9_9BACT|nr:ABC transporter ATP-binding protein [Candidatus Magnetominusculus xianensis]KWT94659.1 multidrug ABC transporter ATP-binding protein [Candidatus Magnetominusculus xianensis]MBF0403371.1 ABC transporter ATP-binding protein [Nitrospirota bacterium]